MQRVGLILLLLAFAPLARAVDPLVVNRCSDAAENNNATALTCAMNSTTTDVIILQLNAYVATGSLGTVVPGISATETFTCPAGAKADYIQTSPANAENVTWMCYVFPASTHSQFITTVTITGGTLNSVSMQQIKGLTAVDSSSATNANGLSVNVTTANSGEWIQQYCIAYSDTLIPNSTNFKNLDQVSFAQTTTFLAGVKDWRADAAYVMGGGAGSYTSSCSETNNIGTVREIVAIAFQATSASHPVPEIVQSCTLDSDVNLGSGCSLYNTTAGNTIVLGYYLKSTGFIFGSPACTESCTCPGAAGISATYAGLPFVQAMCYVTTASSHSQFSVNSGAPGGSFQYIMIAVEVKGIVSFNQGAACASNTCAYNATAGNYVIMFSCDSYTGTAITPGNSFVEIEWSYDDAAHRINGVLEQGMLSSRIATGNGTGSYTPNVATPLISILAFVPTPSSLRVHSQIL